ncbi:hypothetical protein [Bradyrhizobium sp. WSM3983]|uniref:hypothetical protein n=1 Tax=Bradyrhizobium sp. WSM3983 TaxID=1038867 RepID=UPI0004809A7E|nr:hypothetical protein [Bradyrhizobium sp. WSM3983]
MALGLLAAAAIALPPAAGRSTLVWWILSSALAPERILPLVGLGVALALVDRRYSLGALALFGGGLAVGFFRKDWLLSVLEAIPRATSHHFLTGPISTVIVGVALVLPAARLRSWFLLIAAAVAGSMLAAAIEVSDPSLHDIAIPLAGVVVAFWIVAAVSLTVRAFWRIWFPIPARILGSWLIAIGLLYGGASLIPKQKSAFPPPTEPTPDTFRFPEPDRLSPELEPQDRPGARIPPDGLQQP